MVDNILFGIYTNRGSAKKAKPIAVKTQENVKR